MVAPDADQGDWRGLLIHREDDWKVTHRGGELAGAERNGNGLAREAEMAGRREADIAVLLKPKEHGVAVEKREWLDVGRHGHDHPEIRRSARRHDC